jgi:hypothetical protein
MYKLNIAEIDPKIDDAINILPLTKTLLSCSNLTEYTCVMASNNKLKPITTNIRPKSCTLKKLSRKLELNTMIKYKTEARIVLNTM